MLNGIIWLATISYPFLVWFSRDTLQPRYLALTMAGLFLLRFMIHKSNQSWPKLWTLMYLTCALFMLVIAFVNQTGWLLAYPALVSMVFFTVFSYSLFYPPSIIERLARLEDPDLPPKGMDYTRKVTQVWIGFFLLNALISLFTIWYGDPWLWSLYNGGVSYLLMGLLMTVEMIVRRKVKASY
jgi:uncharacterized membrane protein